VVSKKQCVYFIENTPMRRLDRCPTSWYFFSYSYAEFYSFLHQKCVEVGVAAAARPVVASSVQCSRRSSSADSSSSRARCEVAAPQVISRWESS